jgi:hypothetical protein
MKRRGVQGSVSLAPPELVIIRRQDPAGRRVHQMDARTRWTGHRLVDLTLVRRAVVNEPALKVVELGSGRRADCARQP